MAALLAIVVMYFAGCATPETRHEILSFFFDGVPEPGQETEMETETETAGTTEEAVIKQPAVFVHSPYAERRCDLCHESGYSNQLKTAKTKLCGTCHSGEEFEGAIKHGPAVSGQCYGCHDPHKSKFEHLLLESGSAICGKCHTLENYVSLERHRVEQGEDCLTCHSPHSSDKQALLR